MIVEGLSMDEYRAHDGVSASDLKNMQRSPAYARLRVSAPSAAKDWGTAVHCAILEPGELVARYAIDPEHPDGGYPAGWRNTKSYKAEKEAALAEPDRVGVVTREQWGELLDIVEAVSTHEIGKVIQGLDAQCELSVFAEDAGLIRKCRPDMLIRSARMIVDVKSAADHRPGPFSRACKNYGYHITAAYYLDTIDPIVPVEHFVFLVVNSDPPHEIAAYTLDQDSIEQGRVEYRAALERWRACVESGVWPAGSSTIEEIRLPDYAITYYQNEENDRW